MSCMMSGAVMEIAVRKRDAVQTREGRGCLSEVAVGYARGNLEFRVRLRGVIVRFVVGQVAVENICPR